MDELKSGNTGEKILDQNYWDTQYKTNSTGWDLGKVSPPIKQYIDKLEDKDIRILIPGCGNSYEAEYLLEKGFTNITLIDIAPSLVENLQVKFHGKNAIKVILGDFFEHQSVYDLIFEQTFFCALPPTLRMQYVSKMHQLLEADGMLVGLLFNRNFEQGPPFGGNKNEYTALFSPMFELIYIEICQNSISPRAQNELWFEFRKC
jgi:methyl halide transferase